jgi:CDP-diacylglycerol--serine O-phosphatidyltransferase
MERLLTISAAAAVGTGFYLWFSVMLRRARFRQYIVENQWLLHPNSICYWRTAMALVGFVLYFALGLESLAIYIFTFAAILDGVDGIVARSCNMATKLGEWLDPLCDKLTYLPPLIAFAYLDIMSVPLVWALVAVEVVGQFFARHILSLLKISGAANNFGKIKAIICFALVIYCALLHGHSGVIDMADQVLVACLILAAASVVCKFIPNRLYADSLSTLNFCCGVASLVLTYHNYFAWAIFAIIVGQLFDLFDGRMAEKHGGTRYGPYLDDIADFVSFGLSPAYVVSLKGGPWAWVFGAIYVGGVAYRLIRFVAVDKKRTDLPYGIFNGLPSPAGALVVLGAALVVPPQYLWLVAMLSVALMVSHIRFAHFGRVILKEIPKPLFFVTCAALVLIISYIIKTRNVEMFGSLILFTVASYMAAGRWYLIKR